MTGYSSTISYGKQRISFHVAYVDRKTLEIAVHPDTRVMIKAPLGIAEEAIQKRVLKRSRWIIKQINFFRQFEPKTPPRKYVGGETHMYLGKQYRLRIKKNSIDNVKLKGTSFLVTTITPKNRQKIKTLLDEWYLDHAQSIFAKRLESCYASAKRLEVPFPNIRLKKMAKRWGSCSKTGAILLNTELIKAPVDCIDYVIMHELCHLKEHAHNNGYFKLLSKYMPDWEKRKERLEQILL